MLLEYTGSKADRQVIRKHEIHNADARTKALKFDVLLVCSFSPHMYLPPCLGTSKGQRRAACATIAVLRYTVE